MAKTPARAIRDIPDLINAIGDIVCTRYAEARPDLMRRLDFDVDRNAKVEEDNRGEEARARAEDQQDNQRSANALWARLAMLPVGMQEQVMAELDAEYRATWDELSAKGENPLMTKVVEGTVFPGPRGRQVLDGADVENPVSEFHRPVYADHVIIKHDVDPLRSAAVASLFERGLVELGADGPEAYGERLMRRRESILEAYMPRDAASVQDALAQNHPVLTEINRRLGILADTLLKLRPGSEISLTAEGSVEQGIVTRVLMPKRGYEHLASNYDVECVIPGDFMPRRISLGSLLRDDGFALAEGLNGEDYDAILKRFDDALEGARLEQRTMLTGNEWQAMQRAIQYKLGSMVTYQDEHGVRRRGVLVNKSRDLGLNFMPVALRSAQQAAAAMLDAKAEIFGDPDLDAKAVVVRPTRDGRFVVTLPDLNSRKFGFIYGHPPVREMVQRLNAAQGNADAAAPRRQRPQLQVGPDGLPLILRHLLDAGARLYTSASHREWATRWAAENYVNDEEPGAAVPAAA